MIAHISILANEGLIPAKHLTDVQSAISIIYNTQIGNVHITSIDGKSGDSTYCLSYDDKKLALRLYKDD